LSRLNEGVLNQNSGKSYVLFVLNASSRRKRGGPFRKLPCVLSTQPNNGRLKQGKGKPGKDSCTDACNWYDPCQKKGDEVSASGTAEVGLAS